MKKHEVYFYFIYTFFILTLLCSADSYGADFTSEKGFSLKLYGGLNYLSAGDLNKGMEGFSDFWLDILKADGYSSQGEYKPANLGMDFGADFIIRLTANIGLSFGAGYLQSSKSSEIDLARGTAEVTLATKPKAEAIPISAGLSFFFPLSENLAFSVNAGVVYYLAKITTNFRFEESGDWQEFSQSADSSGLGYQGGVGFEIKLSPKISLLIEGRVRYATISGFEGTYKLTESGGWSEEQRGKCYYFKMKSFWSGKDFPFILVQETEPSGYGISDTREAKIDFSGAGLSCGILFRF